MTNETLNNVNNETYVEFTEVENHYEPEDYQASNGSVLGKVVLGVVAASATVLGVVAFKCKDKITAKKEQRAIKKLEKKGYVVYKDSEAEVIDVEAVEAEEVEVETK